MRLFKWIGVGLGSLLGLAVVAAIVVWVAGGRITGRTYEMPDTTFVADPAAADIEEGRRLAILRGCFNGCHGDKLGGAVFVDDLAFGKFIAPDLTKAFRDMSDKELDSVIRHGVRRDGKSTILMPSASFHHLRDEDLNNIAAFIRSQDLSDGPELDARPRLVARFMILRGMFLPQAQQVRDKAPWLIDDDTEGRYLALTVCTECHGMDLRGYEDFSPSLVAAVAYSKESFRRLMREGVGVGDRDLGLMSEMAMKRFSHFTDDEIDSLHEYLQTLVDEPTR
jgi:mono/diheme cytochrome c family protein